MDKAISNWFFNTFGENKPLAIIVRIITEMGSVWFVVALVALLLCFKKTRKFGIFAGVACLIGVLANNVLLKNIVQRARPFEQVAELSKMCELASYSLPTGYSMASGHATATSALAVSVTLQNKKLGFVMIPYSLLVGISRIYLCVHYFTDVLVGFAVGLLSAVAAYYLVKFIIKKIKDKRGNQNEKINLGNQKHT